MKKAILMLAPLLGATACTNNSPKEKQPNIVFILADDLGYGDISCLGGDSSKIKTTHIDCMANEGAVFTDAHSSSSVSTPTRYGILTGRYNWRSTLKDGVLSGYSKALIPANRETIASMLKKQGYTTAGIGKWHLGWDWNNIDKGKDSIDFSQPVKNGPTSRGFDYFYGFCGSLDMPPYIYIENDMPTSRPDRETENNGKLSWWRKGPTGSDFVHEKVLPNLITRACNYITEKAQSNQPYFLYLPLPAPHTPILPIEEYKGKSGLGDYGDFVLMVDDMVGKVIQAIKDSGEEDNTIIVFTSDNGCSPAADIKSLKALGHSPNSIYRGHKADLFEGGHRIPCILKWPAKVKPHKIQQTVCLTDFYATFAAINRYHLQDSEGEDSYNLLPALLSEKEIAPIREATVHHSIEGEFTIRKGKWKLLLSPSSGGWSNPQPNDKEALDTLPPMQLYDMSADERETKNMANLHPDVVSELKNLMIQYIDKGRSTPGTPQKNETEGEWKQMEKLKSSALKQ